MEGNWKIIISKMELRSRKRSTLIEMLRSIGVYEDGMDVEEMSEIAQALQMSTGSTQAEFINLQRALIESEHDFQAMVNSTMIDLPRAQGPSSEGLSEDSFERDGSFAHEMSFARECDSPPSYPVQIRVTAVVHHDLNWSPSRPTVKRKGSQPECELHLKSMPPAVRRRFEVDVIEPPLPGTDSGVSSDELSSLSSYSESSSTPSIGEMPSLHLISTSSAVVSDFSEHQSNSTDFSY